VQILFSAALPGPDEDRGVTAMLGILDADAGTVLHRCEYRTEAPWITPDHKMQFTGYCFSRAGLFACSHTEIVGFPDWPPSRPEVRISIPGFNDLHHCIEWEGGLAVVNTGLETIDEVSFDGELVHRWDLLGGRDARAIDPERDYRALPDTKPHVLHANHVFIRDGELWVTELLSRRAASVGEPRRAIVIEPGMPHDGRPLAGRPVFTTVNGWLVEVDPAGSGTIAHDLRAMTPGAKTLGWCRGVCADASRPERMFVGFTTPRRSRWREYAFKAKYGHTPPMSRIALYDLAARRLVREFDVGHPRAVIFQLDLLPRERWI
jgi:hypothetical protein